MCYERGLGVAQDSKAATAWCAKAAAQGNVNAQYSLGDFYERGVGVAQDCKTAAAWFAKAAAQGDTVAAARLDAYLARVSAAGSRA